MPVDPGGTYQRVSQGTLRVGVSIHPPWTTSPNAAKRGLENGLMIDFARRHEARIEWIVRAESRLIDALDRREIDAAIGGFTTESPWIHRAAATQPYLHHRGNSHVIFVPQGENRWLLEWDRFLANQQIDPPATNEEPRSP